MCVHACVYVYIAGRIDIASCNESGGRGKGQGRGEERRGKERDRGLSKRRRKQVGLEQLRTHARGSLSRSVGSPVYRGILGWRCWAKDR